MGHYFLSIFSEMLIIAEPGHNTYMHVSIVNLDAHVYIFVMADENVSVFIANLIDDSMTFLGTLKCIVYIELWENLMDI